MERKNLAIDVAALAVYFVVANPALTGIGVHEWLSLAVLVVFFVHVVIHADWCLDVMRASRKRLSWVRTGNLVFDLFILGVFVAVIVSGLLISGTVLSGFGLYAEGYYFWDPLHAVAAKALLALLVVHVVIHWKWLASFLKREKGGSCGEQHDK